MINLENNEPKYSYILIKYFTGCQKHIDLFCNFTLWNNFCPIYGFLILFYTYVRVYSLSIMKKLKEISYIQEKLKCLHKINYLSIWFGQLEHIGSEIGGGAPSITEFPVLVTSWVTRLKLPIFSSECICELPLRAFLHVRHNTHITLMKFLTIVVIEMYLKLTLAWESLV